MDDEPLLLAASANLAAWHDCSIRALGFGSSWGRWWWTAPTPAPWIYFTAVALRRPSSAADRRASLDELARHLEDPAGSFEAVCDSFGELDLEHLGLTRRTVGLWYARSSGAGDVAPTAGAAAIDEVTGPDDLAEFERVSALAFGAPHPVSSFDVHAPAILEDPGMHVLVARPAAPADEAGAAADGGSTGVVAGAMAYVAADVVGIYGVGTAPGHRGHGYATALTEACLAIAPDAPATLQPSAAAAALYRRLGFVEIGRFAHWG